jgi:LmbE family N-acetylglucosaminyl deacetylase
MEPVPEDWTSALAIVAHPDDLEYGAASAVARWTRQGKSVVYCMVTSGEAGIDSIPPDRCGPLREDDERRSAALVGVDTVEFLRHPDGLLEASVALRRDLAAVIRRHRPEVLIGINHHDTWPGAWNHVDHRVVGVAMLDAARDAGNRWLFTDAGEPWAGVRFALFNAAPDATHHVDVTDTIDAGIASLRAHQTYLDALDEPTDPDTFLRGAARNAGHPLGLPAAVTFELVGL